MARYHPLDAHVGRRVRQRRTFLDLGQEDLGEALGVTFQQIQKYESGQSQMSPGRLFEVATVLDVPISYFFEGAGSRSKTKGVDKKTALFAQRETLQLVHWYYKIKDARDRKLLSTLVAGLARK